MFNQHLYVLTALLLAAGLFQVSQGSTLISNELWSSCSNTGLFPNFSYAKGFQVISGGAFTCTSGISSITLSPPMKLNVTWFYYDNYTAGSPPTCGNPNLPVGDECCHTTAVSTLTFYQLQYILTPFVSQATSTGNVTAGPFTGHSAKWVLANPNVATLNFNCGSQHGQEAWAGLSSLTIGNGPICLNGAHMSEACPGWKN